MATRANMPEQVRGLFSASRLFFGFSLIFPFLISMNRFDFLFGGV